jgi:hypothetical protein
MKTGKMRILNVTCSEVEFGYNVESSLGPETRVLRKE